MQVHTDILNTIASLLSDLELRNFATTCKSIKKTLDDLLKSRKRRRIVSHRVISRFLPRKLNSKFYRWASNTNNDYKLCKRHSVNIEKSVNSHQRMRFGLIGDKVQVVTHITVFTEQKPDKSYFIAIYHNLHLLMYNSLEKCKIEKTRLGGKDLYAIHWMLTTYLYMSLISIYILYVEIVSHPVHNIVLENTETLDIYKLFFSGYGIEIKTKKNKLNTLTRESDNLWNCIEYNSGYPIRLRYWQDCGATYNHARLENLYKL